MNSNDQADPNTPPAASERMTAERRAEIEALGRTLNWTRDDIAKVPAAIGDLLALVDKQAEELAEASDATAFHNQGRRDALDRIQSLERELAEAKKALENIRSDAAAWKTDARTSRERSVCEAFETYCASKLGMPGTADSVQSSGMLDAAALLPQPDRAKATLTADFTKSLPGGKIDDTTYEQIEFALDRADAPMRTDSGTWLTIAERVATLSARAEAAERELATERTLREAAEWAVRNTKGERVIELEQRVEAAEARAETARAEALEEAARYCDHQGAIFRGDTERYHGFSTGCSSCATGIRNRHFEPSPPSTHPSPAPMAEGER